jgi:DNA-binding LytR/AlgR family response regulator
VFCLNTDEIRFLQAQGNYVEISCTTRRITVGQTMGAFLSGIRGGRFLRNHRSFAVNRPSISWQIVPVCLSANASPG